MSRPRARTSPVWLVDTTLRDGEQAPGLCFSSRDRVELAVGLSAAGVNELELCVAAREEEGWDEPARLRDRGVTARLTSWCRLREDDVARALRTQVDCIHIAVPASPLQLETVGLEPAAVVDRLELCLDRVLDAGRIASVGAVDASRASGSWLLRLAAICDRAGAARFRVADTVGIWEPFTVRRVIGRLRRATQHIAIGVHTHNDLGLATANVLAAVAAGAADVDVTVNGLGERAGNAALEQVAVALAVTKLGSTSLELTRLPALCALVARMSHRELPPGAPVVGSEAFRHSSGIHVSGLLKNPLSFQGFSPSLCGRTSELTVDSHSGRSALRSVLTRAGLEANDTACQALRTHLRRQGAEGGVVIAPEEIGELELSEPAKAAWR